MWTVEEHQQMVLKGCGAEVRSGEEIGTIVAGNEHEGAKIRVSVGTELMSKGDGEG